MIMGLVPTYMLRKEAPTIKISKGTIGRYAFERQRVMEFPNSIIEEGKSFYVRIGII